MVMYITTPQFLCAFHFLVSLYQREVIKLCLGFFNNLPKNDNKKYSKNFRWYSMNLIAILEPTEWTES